ncbi:MAG: chemotaxis protein [Rhodobacteraceae bacterium]|nr:MAG: chemotaxis protein [Paracoccaceae bacterium]
MTLNLKNRAARADDLISEEAYARVAQLLHELTGIHLPQGKRAMVSSRLSRPLRNAGVADIDAYCRVLAQPGATRQQDEFISALTTNTTRFNREAHHFDHLCQDVLPALAAKAQEGRRVRLWSAGCSSGEEAYGLAFHVLDHCPGAPTRDLRILATDIDNRILARARQARYPASALAALPGDQASRYFDPAPAGSTHCQVSAAARQLIAFRHLNLKQDWPFAGRFDVIFCRNVAIYFDETTQVHLWRRLCDRVLPGGVLYIGHSESIPPDITAGFAVAGNGIFQRHGRDTGAAQPAKSGETA